MSKCDHDDVVGMVDGITKQPVNAIMCRDCGATKRGDSPWEAHNQHTGKLEFKRVGDLLREEDEAQPIKPWSLWRHTNGNLYRALMMANIHTERPDQYPVTVVYEGVENGKIWSRPLSEWHRSMTEVNE